MFYFNFASTLAISLLTFAASAQVDLPDRVPIELDDVHVQTLPAACREVEAGPGGKIWLMFDPPEPWSLTQAKAIVEREFERDMPQIIGLDLLGWGRDGRAWFIPYGWTPEAKDDRLLGYDGQRWIEYDNAAKIVAGPVVLDEYELFPGRSGVAVLGSEGWRTELRLNGTSLPANIVPDPGGTSAVVQFRDTEKFYRFRDGRMLQIADHPTIKDDIVSVVSCRFGVFTCLDHKLVWLASSADNAGFIETSQRLDPLFERLETADGDEREAIIEQIVAVGQRAIEPVKARIEKSEDPEVRLTLRRIVLLLEKGQPPDGVEDARPVNPIKSIPGYRLAKVSFVHQLKQGHVLIGVEEGFDKQTSEPLSPGLLVVSPEGEPYFIADGMVNICGLQHDLRSSVIRPVDLVLPISEQVVRLPGHGGSQSWRHGKGTTVWEPNPALLLDLQQRTLTPDSDEILLAIDGQGRRYVAQGDGSLQYRLSSIDVITPGAHDDRLFLDLPEPVQLDSRSYGMMGSATGAAVALTDDGQFYALTKADGLHRFDGEQWHDIPGTEEAQATRLMLIGRAGAVVFETQRGARLVFEQQISDAESLTALIEQQHELMSSQFKGGSLPMMMPELGQIVADKAGNIWLRRNHDVSVYDGETWTKDTGDRVEASAKRSRFRYIASVGDGSTIYITNLISDPPLAYFASLRDGSIHKEDAPHGQPAHPVTREVRDADGNQWVTNTSRFATVWQHDAIRIATDQPPMRIDKHGFPITSDGADNLVLFVDDATRPQNLILNIARDGQVLHTLPAPGLGRTPELSSDQPGSLYGVSSKGLLHWTADLPEEHPHNYALAAEYHIESPGQLQRIYASPRGYLAVIREHDGKLYLHTLDLPLKPRPPLIDVLRAEVKKLLTDHPGWASREPIEALLSEHSPQVQVQALLPFIDYRGTEPQSVYPPGNQVVVQRLGELWEPSLPHILRLLDDDQPSKRAAAALVINAMRFRNQGRDHMPWVEPAGPKLAKMLTDDSAMVRVEAARAIGSFRDKAAPYARELAAALDDESIEVRQMALGAMREVGPDAWFAVPRLIAILNEPGELRRDAAAESLMYMGRAARDAGPALIDLLAEPEAVDGKLYASNALYWIGEHARWEGQPQALAEAIRHGEYGGPAYIAQEFGIDDLTVVAALAESLDVSDDRASYTAMTSAQALVALEPDNPVVLAYLQDLSQADRPYARVLAAAVHARLTGDPDAALPILRSVLSGPDKDQREAAIMAAALLGPAGVDLLPLIKPDTNDRFPWAPLHAIRTSWTLAGKPDQHLAWTASELRHRSTNNSPDEAAKTLAILGPMADPQTPAIASVLDEFVPFASYNRWHATVVLRGVGPTANTRQALPKLKRLLDPAVEPSPYNRWVAAEAIWSISRDADLVASSLADTLDGRGRSFYYATDTLKRMGPAAAVAIPKLEKAASDENPYFREAAEQALKAIRAPAADEVPGQEAYASWYDDLGHEDDLIAIDAVWRFAQAGPPAREFLVRKTRMLTTQQREEIQQSLDSLIQALDEPVRQNQPPDANRDIQEALKNHLIALVADVDAVSVEPQGPGMIIQIDLASRNPPHDSLERNRQHARALQSLQLMEHLGRDGDAEQ